MSPGCSRTSFTCYPSDRVLPYRAGQGRYCLGQSPECAAAMADRVLVVGRHLRGRSALTIRNEDRVVAESVRAARLADEPATERASAQCLFAGWAHQRGDAVKVRPQAVLRNLAELREDEPQVLGVSPWRPDQRAD